METDILRDITGDIACREGDFVTGESKGQEVDAIMVASPGHFKETPQIGPSIFRHMRGVVDILTIRREVAISLEIDNKKLKTLTIASDNMKIQVQ